MLRAVGSTLLWPFRRFFDPRFRGVDAVVEAKHEDLAVRMDLLHRRLDTLVPEVVNPMKEELHEFRALLAATIDTANESNIVIGRTLAELLTASEQINEAVQRLSQLLDAAASQPQRAAAHSGQTPPSSGGRR